MRLARSPANQYVLFSLAWSHLGIVLPRLIRAGGMRGVEDKNPIVSWRHIGPHTTLGTSGKPSFLTSRPQAHICEMHLYSHHYICVTLWDVDVVPPRCSDSFGSFIGLFMSGGRTYSLCDSHLKFTGYQRCLYFVTPSVKDIRVCKRVGIEPNWVGEIETVTASASGRSFL